MDFYTRKAEAELEGQDWPQLGQVWERLSDAFNPPRFIQVQPRFVSVWDIDPCREVVTLILSTYAPTKRFLYLTLDSFLHQYRYVQTIQPSVRAKYFE